MITCQCAEAMRTYATQSSYLTPIPNVNIDRGVIPLDSLPADWWNWLWQNITLNEGYIVQFINSVFSEINSVLSAAGVSPSTASTTDLRDAIQNLAQVVATSSVPGSVLSSTLSGKLNVIADGTATINGLGTPSDLQTTADNVVSAINEVLTLASGKAPISHASSNNTYGVGTTQQFGHVKVTEGCGLSICDGTISLDAPGYNCLGNVTTICFNGNTYTPTDGVIDLGSQTVSVDCVCQRAIASSTSGDFYSLLGGGLCRNTTGVDTVNLTGLSWDPVNCGLVWDNANNGIAIGRDTKAFTATGISIGRSTCNCGVGTIAIGSGIKMCTYAVQDIAIGNYAEANTCYGIAIGYCSVGIYSGSIAIGCCAQARSSDYNSIAIGTCAVTCQQGRQAAVAIGFKAYALSSGPAVPVAIGEGAISLRCVCKNRCFWLSTVGNMYSFHVYTGSYVSETFMWCDLAKVIQGLFRSHGTLGSCEAIYIGKGAGSAMCATLADAGCNQSMSYEGFDFTGTLMPTACACCARWLDIHWGGCWRYLSCTCTGTASWLDIANRHIQVTGTVWGWVFG